MKVTLLKPHTHAGKDYEVGTSIEVSAKVAERLADPARGVIAPLTSTPAVAKPATDKKDA